MTEEQWRFEYEALRLREEQDKKSFEHSLVNILGLNVRPDGEVPFTPLSILLARPETLTLMKRWSNEAEVKKSITEEDEFEKMSKLLAAGAQLASDDDDMQPIITPEQRRHEEALALVPVRKGVTIDE